MVEILASLTSPATIKLYYENVRASAGLYFSVRNPEFESTFRTQTVEMVQIQLREVQEELSHQCSMTLLANIEASFYRDYYIRIDRRLKDNLSRRFREIYNKKRDRARLPDDILQTWREVGPAIDARLIGQLNGAMKYRHWLAHGRRWNVNLDRKYNDFTSIYTLALEVHAAFPLLIN